VAEILGHPAGDVKTRAKVGFLPEHFRFYDWLTSIELLKLHGRLYNLSHTALRERVPALLEMVGLTPHRDKQLKNFSKGMLQRIGLAQALLNEPDLIFLDEPTSGLDPVGRRLVRDIIRAQRDRGATVLLNSHLLGEVEITCDRVAFIKEGEVVETRELHNANEEQTTVSIRAAKLSGEILSGLSQWSSTVRPEGDRLTITVSSMSLLPDVVRYLAAKGADVYEVAPRQLSLEERFLEIVGTDGGL
jgi:ABC-2 type transport system ATP-binding protein